MKIDRTGLVALLIGVIGLVVVYSLRPPSGIGEALVMLSQGRESFIKEPLYEILLALFAIVGLLGIIRLARSK
jgi:uncharacterized membrane protein